LGTGEFRGGSITEKAFSFFGGTQQPEEQRSQEQVRVGMVKADKTMAVQNNQNELWSRKIFDKKGKTYNKLKATERKRAMKTTANCSWKQTRRIPPPPQTC